MREQAISPSTINEKRSLAFSLTSCFQKRMPEDPRRTTLCGQACWGDPLHAALREMI